LEQYAGSLTIGDPVDNSTVVGPLISSAQRDRVEGYLAGAREQGARIVTGGRRPDLKPGFYVAPTLIADATPGMTVAQEEIFGPVVVALAYDTEEEAIEMANGTPYGLYDYVFSDDAGRAWRFAARRRSGNI